MLARTVKENRTVENKRRNKNEVEKSVQSEIRKNEETFKAKWKGLIKVQVDLLKGPTHN